MHLIAMLLGLWLSRFASERLQWRAPRVFAPWQERVCEGWFRHGRTAWLGLFCLLVPPVVLVGILQWLVSGWLFGAVSFLLALAVLLACLPEMRVEQTLRALTRAWRVGDQAEENLLLLTLSQGEQPPEDEPARLVFAVREAGVRAHHNLYALLFWFALLGPAGAVLYRLTELERARSQRASNVAVSWRELVVGLHALLAWLPARLTALGLGLMGSLTDAMRHWQLARAGEQDGNRAALTGAMVGALRLEISPVDRDAQGEVLVEARRLLRRTLMLWLVAFAVLTLIGVLN
ncbi:MAG: regulatory signaling modulator protein AmpE [Ectothiorhodospiraceae bacterium]|nr:regulatory signaling modulator protein AmpE [Ectothiorhodospiraceae bacterium]MCH8505449.1 regulatory signaling modulator protein AmpE [Ectothiorhodospiraceae bacterium]